MIQVIFFQLYAKSRPCLELSFPGQNLSDGVSDRDTGLLNLFPGEANSQTYFERRSWKVDLLLGSGSPNSGRQVLRSRDQHTLSEGLLLLAYISIARAGYIPHLQRPASVAAGHQYSTSSKQQRQASI